MTTSTSTATRPRWADIITFGGAIMAWVIGAGFATGQEALQFFAHLGVWGSVGAGLIAMTVFAWFCTVLLEDGRRLQLASPNDIYRHYCGKYIGLFFEWFVPLMLFMVVSIMFAGAGSTLNEQFGLPSWGGRLIMAVIVLLTVLLGLKTLVRIIGNIGPVILVFVVAIAILTIAKNPGGIATADATLEGLSDLPRAFDNWAVSGLMYGTFTLTGVLPFISTMGRTAHSKTDTRLGGLWGSIGFISGVMLLSFALLAHIGSVYALQVPSLYVASAVVPGLGALFAIMLFLGIYTTAVPMLWTAVNRVSEDEKSTKYRVTAVVATVLAYFGSVFGFSTMINLIYPSLGYLGIILLIAMLYTKYGPRRKQAEAAMTSAGAVDGV